MKRNEPIDLYFDDEGDGARVTILKPVKLDIPMVFSDQEEAKLWTTNFLMPAFDAAWKTYPADADVPFGELFKKALELLILKGE